MIHNLVTEDGLGWALFRAFFELFSVVLSNAWETFWRESKQQWQLTNTDKKEKAFEKVVCFQDSSCWIIDILFVAWMQGNLLVSVLHTNFAGHILKNVSYYQTKTIKQMTQNHSLFGWAKLTFFPKQKYHIQPSFACSSAFFSSSESALSPPHSSWDDRDQQGDLRMEFRKSVDIPRLYMIHDIIHIYIHNYLLLILHSAPIRTLSRMLMIAFVYIYIYIIRLIYVNIWHVSICCLDGFIYFIFIHIWSTSLFIYCSTFPSLPCSMQDWVDLRYVFAQTQGIPTKFISSISTDLKRRSGTYHQHAPSV